MEQIEEINELLKDMWKDELSKTGKFNLEKEIRKLLKYKSAFDEIFEESHYKNITMEDMIELYKKYNLGGE